MPGKLVNPLARLLRRLVDRPAYMLLTARDERLAASEPTRFHRAWWGVMVLSLAWGLVQVAVWGGAWRLFGERTGILFIPTVVTVAVFALWPFRRAVVSLAEVLAGRSPTARGVAACILLMTLAFCLLDLRPGYHFENRLPAILTWLRPYDVLYRVLLLAPLWGGWAMLIVTQFCRPGERTEPAVAQFAGGCGPVASVACMGVLLAGTITYFNYLAWTQLSIPAAAIVAAVAGGPVLCRFGGGLTRRTLLSVNLATQIVFLLAYLANQ